MNDNDNGNGNGDVIFHKVKKAQTYCENTRNKLDEIEIMLLNNRKPHVSPRCGEEPPVQRAWVLLISYDTGGRPFVTVDDSQPFRVTPVLAALISTLALDSSNGYGDCADDPLVPYKSYDEILSRMTEILGREFTERALRQAVCRLRKILKLRRLGGLLETSRLRRAYRLAVWRKKVTPAAASL